MKNILWFMLIVISAVMAYHGWLISASGHTLLELQFVCAGKGAEILGNWSKYYAGDRVLLDVARLNTKIEFLFIVVYVLQLITLSNALMQRERSVFINELLRMNLMLAVLLGLLDVSENIIQLHNFHFPSATMMYISTLYLSIVKWVLAAWILVVLVTSRFKRFF